EATRRDARRGEARRGEARRGEAWRGVARRGEARRGEARRGEARRGDARRPFDVELALHGGRDNVARVHSPSPWLSRRVSLFRVRTCDERVANDESNYATEFTLT
ncbi:hypothetical protein ALC56_08032, partial [Trachymyrmex septentrionalis]